MRLLAPLLLSMAFGSPVLSQGHEVAITAFNSWCFKAGQTAGDIRANMGRGASLPLPFDLTFWDVSLEPEAADLPEGIERRCEVGFAGDHTQQAIAALRVQMATPPVFGKTIPLPRTHAVIDGTKLIEGRELLKGRVAVVHVGLRGTSAAPATFMVVDRLYSGLGLTENAAGE